MRLIILYIIFKGHHIILSRYPVRSIYVSKDKSLSSDDRNYCLDQLQRARDSVTWRNCFNSIECGIKTNWQNLIIDSSNSCPDHIFSKYIFNFNLWSLGSSITRVEVKENHRKIPVREFIKNLCSVFVHLTSFYVQEIVT